MKKDSLVKKIFMECPLCDKIHEIEERKRIATTIIKGEVVDYEENYYFCQYSDEDENEFTVGRMEDRNLLNARNEYRRCHGLLTSDEIIEIRESYGLSQADFARLLGWGEATISRYESKAIQDDAYDNMLRIVKNDPLKAFELFQKNSDKFNNVKKVEIRERIIANLDMYGREYLKRQALESEYISFKGLSDANGNQELNIDKLESIIGYFAKHVRNLYKVKLMKMLWYSDALNYKFTGKSMTGLVYLHDAMGALPIGHYRIVDLENVNVEEEEGYEYTKYRFVPNENDDLSCLSAEDLEILDKVASKFKNFSAKDIVSYMHEERAYKETVDGEVIPYSLAGEIRTI